MFRVDIAFTSTMTLYLIVELILAFCPYPIGAGCKQDPFKYGWHDRSIMWLNFLSSLLIIVLVLILSYKRRKENQARQLSTTSTTQSEELDHFNSKSQDRFQKQITIIAVFYLISSVAELVYIRFCYEEVKLGGLLCIDN